MMMQRVLLRSAAARTARPVVAVPQREFRASGPAASSSLSPHKLQRYSSLGLVGLIPVALLVEPSSLVYPCDLALGFLLPLHMHVGLRDIIRDYVPNPQPAQYALLVVSACVALGLAKLNFNGDGITANAKRLWKKTVVAKKN